MRFQNRFFLIFIILLLGTILIACAEEEIETSEFEISQDYSWATEIVQTITITTKEEYLLSEVEKKYVKDEQGYNLITTSTVLNNLDSESVEAYTTVTDDVVGIDNLSFYVFDQEVLLDYTVSEGEQSELTGNLSPTALSQLNIEDTDIFGDILISIKNEKGKLSSVLISYTSSNLNNIIISIVLS